MLSELEASQKGAHRMKSPSPFAIRSSRTWFTRALSLYGAFALTVALAFADDAGGVTDIFKPDGTPGVAAAVHLVIRLESMAEAAERQRR
jgi:hypothetical protein